MMNFAYRSWRRTAPAAFALATSLVCATAADAQSLALAPAEVREAFKPGEPLRFELTVSNDADTPVTMRASVTDLWFNEKNEKVFSPPGTTPRSAANWIEFVPRDFVVPAKGSGKLNVMVTPPAETNGGYYAVVFVESKPALSQAGTATTRPVFTSMRLGALVLLTSAGTERYDLDVLEGRLTPPGKDRPLMLDVSVSNKGNTHIFPQARVAILDDRHKLVARAESEARRFHPGQTDEVNVSWPGSLVPGKYVALLTLVYGNNRVITREFPFTVSDPAMLFAGQE